MTTPAAQPSRKSGWFGDLLVLLAVVLVCLPPMVVSLRRPPVTRVMEKMALSSSQETWLRQEGSPTTERDPAAWKMPSYNGGPRLRKPPLLVWLNLLAWRGLSTSTSEPAELVFRARLVSAAMGLLLVCGTFLAGRFLRDRATAAVAALAAGTMWFVQREAQTAAYDIHMAAWTTLAVASALWALREPLGGRGPWATGWILAGLWAGLGWMTKGPLALAVTVLPLALIVTCASGARTRGAGGLILMTAVAATVALPWYVYARMRYPAAFAVMGREYAAQRDEFQTPFYYLGLLGLVLPWTWWLVYGLVLPWGGAARPRARDLVIPLFWLTALFVMFSIPAAKQQRYILPAIPAAALVIARACLDGSGPARPRPWLAVMRRWVARLHWASLLVLSLVAAGALASYPWLVRRGWAEAGEVAAWSVSAALALGAWLVILTVVGWRMQSRGRAGAAAVATAVWMVMLSTVLWQAYRRDRTWDHIDGVKRVRAAIGDERLYYLNAGDRDKWLLGHCSSTMFYVRRVILPVEPDGLSAGAPGIEYLLAFDEGEHRSLLESAGYGAVDGFRAEGKYSVTLWHREPM